MNAVIQSQKKPLRIVNKEKGGRPGGMNQKWLQALGALRGGIYVPTTSQVKLSQKYYIVDEY